MADEEDNIAALLERAQLIIHSLRPVFPAGTQHLFHLSAVSRQEHVDNNHSSRQEKCLHLGEVSSAAIQPMHQQNTDHRFGRRRGWMLLKCWLGSRHSPCFPFVVCALSLIRSDKHVGYGTNTSVL